MFKIRRPDGMFSKGGMDPTFSKTGKTWRTMGHVNSHLNQVRGPQYFNCEIVEYEMVEVSTSNVATHMNAIRQRKIDKENDRKLRREEFLKSQRRKQYEELKAEFSE